MAGLEAVTLLPANLPAHSHLANATVAAGGGGRSPANGLFAASSVTTEPLYADSSAQTPLSPTTLGPSGGSGAHANMQPYQVINFSIALTGIFPSRN